jgi:hypothetical protein
LSLIILACATVALFLGKLDSMAYAAVIGTVGTIYCYTAYRTDTMYSGYNFNPGFTYPNYTPQQASPNLYDSIGGQDDQGPGTGAANR